MLAHIHPYLHWFACEARPIFNGLATLARSPGLSKTRHVPRAPLPDAGVTSIGAMSTCITSEGVTPPSSLIRAHAPDQNPPVVFGFPYWTGLCRLLPVPTGRWSFPTLSLQSVHRCLDPYPGMPLWCIYPFLPRELQPHPRCTEFGASDNRRNATSTTTPISRRQFRRRRIQAPMLASPPGCTYRAGSKSYGQPGRLRHAMDWKLPSRTMVSLHDRNGQLSWRDLHPLDCSLVGCYLEPFRVHH